MWGGGGGPNPDYFPLVGEHVADNLDEEGDQESDLDDDPDHDEDDLEEDIEDDNSDQAQDDPDDDGMGIFRQAQGQPGHPAGPSAPTEGGGVEDDADAAEGETRAGLSKHERQQQRMQQRIARLEAQNLAAKDWFMQGESGAGESAAGRHPHAPNRNP